MQRAIEAGDVTTVSLLIRDTFPYRRRRDDMHGPEALSWLDQAMPKADNAPPDVRGRLMVMRVLIGGLFDDAAGARSLLPQGRALIPDDANHALDQAVAAVASIYYAVIEGSPEGVGLSIQEALRRFTALGNTAGQA